MTDEEKFVHQHIEEFRYLRQTEGLIDEAAASFEARKSVPWRPAAGTALIRLPLRSLQ